LKRSEELINGKEQNIQCMDEEMNGDSPRGAANDKEPEEMDREYTTRQQRGLNNIS
jgi:hypothetical protein